MFHPQTVIRSKFRYTKLFQLDIMNAFSIIKNKREEKNNITLLKDQKEIIDFIKDLPHDKVIAFDIETSLPTPDGKWNEGGLDPYHPKNNIYTCAFAYDDSAYAFPVHPIIGGSQEIQTVLKKSFERLDNLVAHNSVFEYKCILKHFNVRPRVKYDTQILAYLANETLQGFYSLESLVNIFLQQTEYKSKKSNLLEYNAYDALYTLKILHILIDRIKNTVEYIHIKKAHNFIIERIVPLLAEVELNGFGIDMDYIDQTRKEVLRHINALEKAIESVLRCSNPNSIEFRHALNAFLLANGIKLPSTKLSKTKLISLPSVSSESLTQILNTTTNQEVKRLVLFKISYTKLSKIMNTYLDKYPEFINPVTQRIHTHYNITSTKSGRICSNKPNFQQIPARGVKVCPKCSIVTDDQCPICSSTTIDLVNLKGALKPENGYVIVGVDYSQMEVRVLAHLSEDENLIDAIKKKLDLHSFTASKIYKIPYEEIVQLKDKDLKIKEMRRLAKSVTFGIIYGITPQGLAKQLNITLLDAQEFIDSFFKTYPKVKSYIDRVHEEAINKKYVFTPIGRVRHFDEKVKQDEMLREAQNYVVQSYASDLALDAASELKERLRFFGGRIIGLVHDSIKIEVPKENLDIAQTIIQAVCCEWLRHKHNLKVPLEIDIEVKE